MNGEDTAMVPVLRTAQWRYHGVINGDNTAMVPVLRTALWRYHCVMNCDNTVMVPRYYGQHCGDIMAL